jgi:hypothetical protein
MWLRVDNQNFADFLKERDFILISYIYFIMWSLFELDFK